MLDENLPTFFIKPASADNPHSSTIFLSQNGSELQPEYTLRRPNPDLPASQNRYGVALYDSYNPEVLYAEVLVEPEWTQPTLSQAEIRAQNGIPPPPVPIVPNSFIIQLYNPDQQVLVRQVAGTWNTSAYWEFQMPQSTFRLPSTSALDRSQSDPALSAVTPKVTFKWRRDGKLSKDISCHLASNTGEGKKSKEPDIICAMFKGGKNLTIYQPNMHRVDVEDVKGLEVVFILGAAVIKDIFFNANRDMFNIKAPTVTIAAGKRKNSGPASTLKNTAPPGPVMSGAIQAPKSNTVPASQIHAQDNVRPRAASGPPPANARTEWEINAETTRLKALVEAEERERAKQEMEEERRIKQMLEAEERERRRKEAEVAQETERLRRQYGVPGAGTSPPRVQFQQPARHQQQQYPVRPQGMPQHQSAPHSRPAPVLRPQSTPLAQSQAAPSKYSHLNGWLSGIPSQRPGHSASSSYSHPPGAGAAQPSGFFARANDAGKKLAKKQSVFF